MAETTTKDRVAKFDKGMRHTNARQEDFLKHYTELLDNFSYATTDHSWNQLEKQLTHVLGMYVYCRRFLELIGAPSDFNVRKLVDEHEEMQIKFAADKGLAFSLLVSEALTGEQDNLL